MRVSKETEEGIDSPSPGIWHQGMWKLGHFAWSSYWVCFLAEKFFILISFIFLGLGIRIYKYESCLCLGKIRNWEAAVDRYYPWKALRGSEGYSLGGESNGFCWNVFLGLVHCIWRRGAWVSSNSGNIGWASRDLNILFYLVSSPENKTKQNKKLHKLIKTTFWTCWIS